MHPPAPFLVLQADDNDIRDLGVLHEGDLDLGGIDVRPAADDQVDPPVHQVQKAVFVQIADVADRAQTISRHPRLAGSEVRRPAVEG